jgi:hypothetical protein
MEDLTPRVIENREFVALEEEDIQRLNRSEAEKFESNPELDRVIAQVEAELGRKGNWEEHWLTIDAKGRRVYARIYYTADRGLALTSDGRIIRELNYPPQDGKQLH